jgi:stigma-specific protein Stig1
MHHRHRTMLLGLALSLMGSGMFATAAHADNVTLCHYPPGEPTNMQQITVDQSAVADHLAHGDFLGPCCQDFQTMCQNACVDVLVDDNNCGRCGRACSFGTVCDSGRCVCSNDGYLVCSRACTDPLFDSKNCGSCGFACRGGQSCCDGQCADLDRDPNNCGACGNVCDDGMACLQGTCQ